MKLATFVSGSSPPVLGVVSADGATVIDVREAHHRTHGDHSPVLASMLALIEQGRFLEDGDVVELEIQGIGVLRNRFVR